MVLGHIERGTHLYIFEELNQSAISEVYQAEFHYLETETSFIVRCNRLYERFSELDSNAHLNISLMTGPYINTFIGAAKEKQRGGHVLIEQLSEIVSRNRRQFDRDEIRVPVWLYSLPEDMLMKPSFEKPAGEPVLADMTFDISVGGMCIITNKSLNPDNGPLYLMEFSLAERDYHVLPAKLVRRSKYARTSIGRFDYGFQFALENMPDEVARLTKGIIYRKISLVKI